MQRLDPDANVYKLIGPVLVKQDHEEAKQNVQKRIDYINTELWVYFKWLLRVDRVIVCHNVLIQSMQITTTASK